MKRISYNSPVILTFAFVSLAVLGLGYLTGGASNLALFSVYRAPLSDILTWPRFFLHVLGHGSLSHYINNIMLILVIGPPMEEKYGSRALLFAIGLTALVAGAAQYIFFPGTALLGASGIVFMLIVMASLSGMRGGDVPLTLILVLVLYLGNEVVNGLFRTDNVSQITHILGGVCGALLGYSFSGGKR